MKYDGRLCIWNNIDKIKSKMNDKPATSSYTILTVRQQRHLLHVNIEVPLQQLNVIRRMRVLWPIRIFVSFSHSSFVPSPTVCTSSGSCLNSRCGILMPNCMVWQSANEITVDRFLVSVKNSQLNNIHVYDTEDTKDSRCEWSAQRWKMHEEDEQDEEEEGDNKTKIGFKWIYVCIWVCRTQCFCKKDNKQFTSETSSNQTKELSSTSYCIDVFIVESTFSFFNNNKNWEWSYTDSPYSAFFPFIFVHVPLRCFLSPLSLTLTHTNFIDRSIFNEISPTFFLCPSHSAYIGPNSERST